MEIDCKELKRQSRERMTLTDPKFWVVALAYLAMTVGLSWLISLIPLPNSQTIHLFFQLLLNLYTTVVHFGMCLWALWTWRQLDPGVNSLMQGFSVAGRVIVMELGIYLRVLGWYLVVAFTLAMPVFILLIAGAGAGLGMFTLFLFFAGLIATIIVLQLRYALAPYLLADRPDDGSSLPIYRSVSLMRGWKWELFKLEFSFIGWEAVNFLLTLAVLLFSLNQAGLLPVDMMTDAWRSQAMEVLYSTPVVVLSTLVTVPVSLWLIPYKATARAGFYDARLVAAQGTLPEMPPL